VDVAGQGGSIASVLHGWSLAAPVRASSWIF
jgi:hypothetical protein